MIMSKRMRWFGIFMVLTLLLSSFTVALPGNARAADQDAGYTPDLPANVAENAVRYLNALPALDEESGDVTPKAYGNYRAVVVGINVYEDPDNNLAWCVKDATDIRADLIAKGWTSGNIQFLTDTAATKTAIQNAIMSMHVAAGPGDLSLFYFSGHGTTFGGHEFIIPHDYTGYVEDAISDTELDSWLSMVQGTKVAMFDSCYSGGMARAEGVEADSDAVSKYLGSPSSRGQAVTAPPGGFAKDLNKPGFVVLMACAAEETSLEYGALQHGLFTYYVLEGANTAAADTSHNGISAEEIFTYADPKTTSYALAHGGYHQNPEIYDGVAGEVILSANPASITVTYPNAAGITWGTGSSKTITWTSNGVTGNVNIQISRNGGTTYTSIVTNTPNDGTQAWTVTAPVAATARIKVVGATPATSGVWDASDNNFAIAVPPAAPSLVSPNPGANVFTLTPTLTWRASTTGATSYGVQVSTASTFATTVVDVSGIVPVSYTVLAGPLAWNTTYYWRANASNAVATSAWSAYRSFKTVGPPPVAPSGLYATAISSSRIDLTWFDNSTGETGFKIERKKAGGTWALAATVGPNVTAYNNTTGLMANTQYIYRVRAYLGTLLVSDYSNEADATTLPPPPPLPGTPTWLRPSIPLTSITFNWDAASGTVDYYLLQVNTSPAWTGTDIFNGSVGNVTSYTVSGFPNTGITYYWRVIAHNAKGNGPASATLAFINGISPPTSITVTVPNTNLFWSVGSTRTITWTYTGGNAATVTIELYKGGVLNRSIATGVAMGNSGSGSYNWPIPPGQAEGTDYRIKLTTSNALTDSSDVNFTIKVPQRIQVELSWNTSGTDVDTMFYSPTDSLCYYANKTPNWGTYGNPVLDRDDVDGYGPEVLTLNNPGTGVYKYKVYYYSDHGLATPATTATVKVWIDGVLQGTWSQAITNHRTWNVCTITGPACTVAYVGGVTEPPAGEIRDETKPLK